MRVLHVIPSVNPEGGGPIEGIRQLSDEFLKQGHEVHVVSCDDPGAPWVTSFPLPVTALGPSTATYGYSSNLVPWLAANAGAFDGVVANGLWQYSGVATRKAMRRLRRPYVVYTHGMLDPWFKRAYPLKHLKKWLYWPWAEYKVLRDAAAVIFTCEEERILARQSFPLYQANERVATYGTAGPNGDPALQKEAFLVRYPHLRDKRLILFLSRIHPKKGCDLLLRAWAQEARARSEMHLVLAGPDQVGWQKELESLACTLGIFDQTSWPGMLSGDLKWGAFHASEAFALPSHQENFGIVVAEALACAKPVLISNRVNIWREIDSDGAGFVTEDTEDGAAELLRRWLSLDSVGRNAMATDARRCFEKRFEIGIAARGLMQVLREVQA